MDWRLRMRLERRHRRESLVKHHGVYEDHELM